MFIKILVSIGSICMAGFGFWHFFVPKLWNWYSYISPEATELVVAVRAVNIFFSLCLVLFGIINMLFIFLSPNRISLIIILSATVVLWGARSVLQIIYPQGSLNPALQYGMLAAFIFIFVCFSVSLLLAVFEKN